MSSVGLIFAIACLPIWLGAGLLGLLGLGLRETRGLERFCGLARAWALGFLALGLLLWGWAWCELPWRPAPLIGAALALALLVTPFALHTTRRTESESGAPAREAPSWRPWEWGLFALALAVAQLSLLDRALLSNLEPICRGDEALIWTAAAKALFASGGYTADFGRALTVSVAHADYPALNPLWQSFVFGLQGTSDAFHGRLPMQVAACVLLWLLGTSLARHARPGLAALAVLALAGFRGAPQLDLVQTANSDGLVALGLLVTVDAWLRFRDERRSPWLVVAAAGLALALFAKNEGQLHALGFAASALLWLWLERLRDQGTPWRARELRATLLAGFVLVLPWLLGAVVHRHFGIEGDMTGRANAAGAPIWVTFPQQLFERGPLVVRYLARHVLFEPAAGGLWFLALGMLVVTRPDRMRGARLGVPTLMVAGSALGFALVFIGSVHHLGRGPGAELWHLDTAAVRVFGQLLPATALVVGCLLAPKIEHREVE